jgi:hypothetical protein
MEDDFVEYTAIQVPVFTLYATRLSIQKNPRSAHTVYLCVLCGSQNKQQIFPCTPLTDSF